MMRQTIGGTWLLQLMILFILLFVGFIVLTLNYSRTVKIKNELINMFEKYEGLNDASIELVNNYLLYTGYDVEGVCVPNGDSETGVYGALDLNSTKLEPAREGEKYYYCVKKYKGANTTNYYQITIFYKFNLPIIGDTSSFTIKGTTSNFQAQDDKQYENVIGD
ncbi:unknown [Mycoplasma sp. CAG:776]|nr:unknown [Mycoplasma sp. CAG:776]